MFFRRFDLNFLFMDTVTSFDEDYEFDVPVCHTSGTSGHKGKSPSRSKFARLARGLAGKRHRGNKWRQLIEATRSKVMPFSRSSESVNSETVMGSQGKEPLAVSDIRTTSLSTPRKMSTHQLDANLKRSMFARKFTSLMQEESNSGDDTLDESVEIAAHVGSPKKPKKTNDTIIAVTQLRSRNEWI